MIDHMYQILASVQCFLRSLQSKKKRRCKQSDDIPRPYISRHIKCNYKLNYYLTLVLSPMINVYCSLATHYSFNALEILSRRVLSEASSSLRGILSPCCVQFGRWSLRRANGLLAHRQPSIPTSASVIQLRRPAWHERDSSVFTVH